MSTLEIRKIMKKSGKSQEGPWEEGPVCGEEGEPPQKQLDRRRPSPYLHIVEAARVPQELLGQLPSKWKRLGDAVVLRLSEGLLPYKEELGRCYAEYLGASTVFLTTAAISQEFRRPSVERIFGESSEVTTKENGVSYTFDITKLMYSKGNTPERARVCKMDMLGEKVLDMFAGIGYFCLPAAKCAGASQMVAVEKNPVSHGYLERNIVQNRLQGRVRAVLGDNRVVELDSDFNRVFMGYLQETWTFLPVALRALEQKGGVIHYHTNIKRRTFTRLRKNERIDLWELGDELRETLKELLPRSGLEFANAKLVKVKSYAPSVYHVVFDLRLETRKKT